MFSHQTAIDAANQPISDNDLNKLTSIPISERIKLAYSIEK